MHLIATYYPVCTDCAFSTSEKVPSPNFLINLYSIEHMITSLKIGTAVKVFETFTAVFDI